MVKELIETTSNGVFKDMGILSNLTFDFDVVSAEKEKAGLWIVELSCGHKQYQVKHKKLKTFPKKHWCSQCWMKEQLKEKVMSKHISDCTQHNEPPYRNTECDCSTVSLMDKIEAYPFNSKGGDLKNCTDWIKLKEEVGKLRARHRKETE